MTPKFRAWHKKEKKMIILGECIELRLDDSGWMIIDDYKQEVVCNEEDGILLQSTGLKDKNGKEIFEGDILKVTRGKNNPYIVEWSQEVCMFCLASGKSAPMNLLDKYQDLYEIIGNIYENPELLKEAKP